jgi:DNA-binding response OmpR family regulator
MNEKILIIDREPDIRKTLAFLLTQEGYQTRGTSSGEEAISILDSESFDMVIMDINLPGTNGLQVMRNIMEREEDVKVIVLTGLASIDNAVQALRAEGAFDFLGKPLENYDQLVTSVKQALEKRRLNREKNTLVRELGAPEPQGKKILIVDDDPQMPKLLTTILSAHQYETEVAADGFEAGVKVTEFKPHLIILDLMMPGMDGFEVCRRIKENSGTSLIKILAITGFDSQENRDRIMGAGADDYLAKPLAKDTLLQHIINLLDHKGKNG